MHQKVWFSQKILTEISRILTYRKISKKRKLIIFFLFPATVSVTCRSYYLIQYTHWHPKTLFYTQGRSLYGSKAI